MSNEHVIRVVDERVVVAAVGDEGPRTDDIAFTPDNVAAVLDVLQNSGPSVSPVSSRAAAPADAPAGGPPR